LGLSLFGFGHQNIKSPKMLPPFLDVTSFLKKLTTLEVIFILYAIGAADYLNGGDSFLTKPSGAFIEFLRQPGGISEFLHNTANSLTESW